ncbi:MAG: M20/M25/M40 family metallo-hydrolase [Chloroflexi bacterium]|nr:M20/M25/M40 family metallo-hydrolase [Chloroflexota bacterium]
MTTLNETLDDLLALLPIPGPPAQEGEVAAWLRARLAGMGIPEGQMVHDRAQEQSEYGGDVGNLIVQIPGCWPGPRLLFSTHMDTVPIAVGCRPRLDREQMGIVNDAPGRALGGDNRLGCAALLHLARVLLERKGDHPPVVLIFFVQEEVGLVGSRGLDISLLGQPLPAMCFNLDGGPPDEFVTAVIGAERFTVEITGIAAHAGAHPADGLSAAVLAARSIATLDGDGWHGRIEKSEGIGSANVGILRGGQGSNVVMPDLHILAEARSHDPAFRQKIIERWKAEFIRVAQEMTNQKGEKGAVSFGPGPTYEAFALDESGPTIQRALAAARQMGIAARLVSNDGGMDANRIVAHGIPALTVGVGQRRVHQPEEWIDLADFERVCRLVVEMATMGAS